MAAAVRDGAYYFLGLAIICLAAALVYFTLELAMYRESIPSFLEKVESTSGKIEPVVKEIGEIRAFIPDVLEEIKQSRALVIPVLNEVTEYRKQIPIILEEVRKTRQQVPVVTNEIKEVRKQLPAILKSADKASSAVTTAANEISATRPLIPKILNEVKKTRELIPPTLDRVDRIIAGAEKAGKKASKGAVTGIFSGILTSPFTFLNKLGEEVIGLDKDEKKNLTAKDIEFIKGIANQLLIAEKAGVTQPWSNQDSGHHGKVILQSIDIEDGQECRNFVFDVWKDASLLIKKEAAMCQEENGEWERSK